jgi:transcriptional regulator GlxA family with amidase domain
MDTTRRNLMTAGLVAGAGLALHTLPRAAAQALEPQPTAALTEPIKLQIVLFDGFQVTDALAPFDVLRIAGHSGAAFETSLVTLDSAVETVTALEGVRVARTATFDPNADLLIVPGAPSLWRQNIMPPGLATTLTDWRSAGKTLVTVCTGAVLAARAGVLTGRNVNTHHLAFDVIKQLGVNLITARVVDDGDIISSAGMTSGIDLALYLVERYASAQIAIAVEQVAEYERRGTVWRAAAA